MPDKRQTQIFLSTSNSLDLLYKYYNVESGPDSGMNAFVVIDAHDAIRRGAKFVSAAAALKDAKEDEWPDMALKLANSLGMSVTGIAHNTQSLLKELYDIYAHEILCVDQIPADSVLCSGEYDSLRRLLFKPLQKSTGDVSTTFYQNLALHVKTQEAHGMATFICDALNNSASSAVNDKLLRPGMIEHLRSFGYVAKK